MTGKMSQQLGGLEALLQQANARGSPPVDTWEPPYCGDIGLKIASDGTWFYRGSSIGRKPLVALFASVLRRDADGRFYLVTPAEKVDVTVDDAPFLAVQMEVRGEGRSQDLMFRTNVDDVAICGPEHPMRFAVEPASGGLKPYVTIRGRLEALVTRAVTYDLMALAATAEARSPLTEHDTAPSGIWSGGVFFPFPI
jgi:uncharacterized protein